MGESRASMPDSLLLFERWLDTTKWLLERTARFPKRLRHSLTDRLENTALEILEGVTTAAYTKDRAGILVEANEALNRLRVLVRLSQELRALSEGQYEEAARRIDEAGRMLGGWMKSSAE